MTDTAESATPSQPSDLACSKEITIVVERAVCPRCNDADIQTQRTEQQGDGSKLRWTRCRACGWTFKVIVEERIAVVDSTARSDQQYESVLFPQSQLRKPKG